MKWLTFGQLLVICTFFQLSAQGINLSLPDKLSIKIGDQTIYGFRANLPYMRQLITDTALSPNQPHNLTLATEGFAYQLKAGEVSAIEVIAWSESGQRTTILAEARRALEHQIETKQPVGEGPSGYRYSVREYAEFGTPKKVAPVPPKIAANPQPVLEEKAETKMDVVQAQIAKVPLTESAPVARQEVAVDWGTLALATLCIALLILATRGTVLYFLR